MAGEKSVCDPNSMCCKDMPIFHTLRSPGRTFFKRRILEKALLSGTLEYDESIHSSPINVWTERL